VSAASWEAARYVFVWTSLPEEDYPAESVLELYRLRWQIELTFKRMKSLLGLGQLPKHNDESARAWLHGKLFVALLVERLIEEASVFSPWGYALECTP
jgi:IS4 transposase